MEADFVVDASGRNSKAPNWLLAAGYAQPAVSTVNAFLGYATRWYRKPANFDKGWKGVITGSLPTSNPRSGVILPVEGDHFVVTLVGIAREYPPCDEAGFLEFARKLIRPTIHDAITELEPVSPIHGYRRTENRWRHFERLARWPDRFVVLGDAACCFNPVYAQGMTMAALEALALGSRLRSQGRDLNGLAHNFQRGLPSLLKATWTLSTCEDFRWPTTEGGAPSSTARFTHWYVDRLFELMPNDQTIVESFLAVQHLLVVPRVLFRPSLFARVMMHGARRVSNARRLGVG
jgi:2-polyprenyl-6-methoxyphenol hydroxylase-like FAD-dependent oxidoreductase